MVSGALQKSIGVHATKAHYLIKNVHRVTRVKGTDPRELKFEVILRLLSVRTSRIFLPDKIYENSLSSREDSHTSTVQLSSIGDICYRDECKIGELV